MKLVHIVFVIIFAFGMGCGQLLIKYAAIRQSNTADLGVVSRLIALIFDWPFVLGAASYVFLLLFWVWLLTFLPLSRAYPFTLLSLVVTTVGSAFFFQEPISSRFLMGLAVMTVGLLLLGAE